MKKIIMILTILVMILTLFGCSNSNIEITEDEDQSIVDQDTNENSDEEELDKESVNESDDEQVETVEGLEMTIEQVITATYEAADLEMPMTGFLPLTKDNQEYMLGANNFDFEFGIVSEPMMGSVAHSFVMFTVSDDADIEAIKESIKANVDPVKWICVGVEPEQVIVENFGNVLVLIMEERSDIFFSELEKIMEEAIVVSSELAESAGESGVGMTPEVEVPVGDMVVGEIIVEETGINLEDLITATYEASDLELPVTGFIPLTVDNQEYMTGTSSFNYLEGVVSEPMMGSIAHSIVLIRVEQDADIEGIKEDIRTNIDLNKWVCVGIEPEQLVVENFDNMIVIIMEERSDVFYETLKGIIEQQ